MAHTIDELVSDISGILINVGTEVKEFEEEGRKAEAHAKSGRYSTQVAADYSRQAAHARREADAARARAVDTARRAVRAYQEEQRARDVLNPNDVDGQTLALLGSGVRLTEADASALLGRFEGNSTMCRAIHARCDDLGLRLPRPYVAEGAQAAREAEDLMPTIDIAARYIGDEGTLRRIFKGE